MSKSKTRPSRSLSHSDADDSNKSSISAATGLFGRDLSEIILQNGLPAILEDCINWIETHALDEEGLFRIPADPKELKKLREMYDAAPKSHIDLSKEGQLNPHSVAALLKAYLRELPEPLLLYRFYDTFIKVAKNEDTETRLRNLRLLVQGLPVLNRTVLLYLLKFLNNFSSHSSNNKMTLTNLATCWAPNLLRAKEENYEKVLREANLVNAVVSMLIENINYIGVEKKSASSNHSDGQIPSVDAPPPSKPTFSDGVIPAVPAIAFLQTRAERSHSSNSGATNPVAETPRKDSISDWREAITKDGRKYYYNIITRETSWVAPDFSAPEHLQRANSDDSALAASKNKVSEKIEGVPSEQFTHKEEPKPEPKQESPKIEVKATPTTTTTTTTATATATTPPTPTATTATATGYINPAKTNTVTIPQLRAMLDEVGVDHSNCVTRTDLVKKVMESFTVNLPPPLPPAPRKN